MEPGISALLVLWFALLVGTNWVLIALRCLTVHGLWTCTALSALLGARGSALAPSGSPARLCWRLFRGPMDS
ncbi:MAG: hypothetical protein ACREMO_11290 [Gemmatimonadales bacterium]